MNNEQIVSITSQGQLTIPKIIRKRFGILRKARAAVWQAGDKIIVEPKKEFWGLKGVLSSKVKLTDAQLRKARQAFAKRWAKND